MLDAEPAGDVAMADAEETTAEASATLVANDFWVDDAAKRLVLSGTRLLGRMLVKSTMEELSV